MMSSLANTILFVALVATSVIVVVMYTKLRRLDAYHAEYRQIFDKTEKALLNTQRAVADFGNEGKNTLTALGDRIEEAKALIERLENLSARSGR